MNPSDASTPSGGIVETVKQLVSNQQLTGGIQEKISTLTSSSTPTREKISMITQEIQSLSQTSPQSETISSPTEAVQVTSTVNGSIPTSDESPVPQKASTSEPSILSVISDISSMMSNANGGSDQNTTASELVSDVAGVQQVDEPIVETPKESNSKDMQLMVLSQTPTTLNPQPVSNVTEKPTEDINVLYEDPNRILAEKSTKNEREILFGERKGGKTIVAIIKQSLQNNNGSTTEPISFVTEQVDDETIAKIAEKTKTPIVRKVILGNLYKRRSKEAKAKSSAMIPKDPIRNEEFATDGAEFRNRLKRYLTKAEVDMFIPDPSSIMNIYTYVDELEKVASNPGMFKMNNNGKYQGIDGYGLSIKDSPPFIPPRAHQILSKLYVITQFTRLLRDRHAKDIAIKIQPIDQKIAEMEASLQVLTANQKAVMEDVIKAGLQSTDESYVSGVDTSYSSTMEEIEQIQNKLEEAYHEKEHILSNINLYIPEEELQKYLKENPTASLLSEWSLIKDFVRTHYRKEYDTIIRSKRSRMYKNGTITMDPVTMKEEKTYTMPLNIIVDFVSIYLPNTNRYEFLYNVVEWIMLIGRNDEEKNAILIFDTIPGVWFDNAREYDDSHYDEIDELEAKYVGSICSLITRNYSSMKEWCNLRMNRIVGGSIVSDSNETPVSNIQTELQKSNVMQVYPNLVILPSKIANTKYTLDMEPNLDKGILSLPPKVQNHEYRYDTMLSYFTRLKEIFIFEGKKYDKKIPPAGDPSFKTYVLDFFRKWYSQYDIMEVIIQWLVKVKKIIPRTAVFAIAANNQASKFMEKDGGHPCVFEPISSSYFPPTVEGDRFYMEHLYILGYVAKSGYEPYLEKKSISVEEYNRIIPQEVKPDEPWKKISYRVKSFEKMKRRLQAFKNEVKKALSECQDKIPKELMDATLQIIDDPNTSPVEIMRFAIFCLPLSLSRQGSNISSSTWIQIPPSLGKEFVTPIENFAKIAQILGTEEVIEQDKTIFNRRLLGHLNQIIDDFDPGYFGMIPRECFYNPVIEPSFYQEYVEEFQKKVEAWRNNVEAEAYKSNTSDNISRLQKLLIISRMNQDGM